jgi:hypothetical protein
MICDKLEIHARAFVCATNIMRLLQHVMRSYRATVILECHLAS